MSLLQDVAKYVAENPGIPLDETLLESDDERIVSMVAKAASTKPYAWKLKKDTHVS